jgi:hypothetical protein
VTTDMAVQYTQTGSTTLHYAEYHISSSSVVRKSCLSIGFAVAADCNTGTYHKQRRQAYDMKIRKGKCSYKTSLPPYRKPSHLRPIAITITINYVLCGILV